MAGARSKSCRTTVRCHNRLHARPADRRDDSRSRLPQPVHRPRRRARGRRPRVRRAVRQPQGAHRARRGERPRSTLQRRARPDHAHAVSAPPSRMRFPPRRRVRSHRRDPTRCLVCPAAPTGPTRGPRVASMALHTSPRASQIRNLHARVSQCLRADALSSPPRDPQDAVRDRHDRTGTEVQGRRDDRVRYPRCVPRRDQISTEILVGKPARVGDGVSSNRG